MCELFHFYELFVNLRTIRRKTTNYLKFIFNGSKKRVKNEGGVGTILKKESLGGNPGSFLIRTL
jgi:hypothetical protein